MMRETEKKMRALTAPACGAELYEKCVKSAEAAEVRPERLRMGNVQFFSGQLRFIRKSTWAAKLFLTLTAAALVFTDFFPAGAWPLCMVVGPLLCLANAAELCGILMPGIKEIQMCARFSMKKLLAARLAVFGIADAAALFLAAAALRAAEQELIWKIGLYLLTPYQMMSFGCLLILNKCREESAMVCCGAWGGAILAAQIVLRASGNGVFSGARPELWMLAALFGAAGTGAELIKLMRKAGGCKDEVKYGTFIERV